MKQPQKKTAFFFVDESGDPAFYGKGGAIIVGAEGCSRVLLLGFVETDQPHVVREALNRLRDEVSADAYLKSIPSVAKTMRAFHAKDDCAEVRMMVFKELAKLPFTAQVIVARKIEAMFRTRYQGSQDKFYDELVTWLFQDRLHRSVRNEIVFARRGTKTRQHALREAIERGVERFRKKWRTELETEVVVSTSQPGAESLLQVVDYTNWAVYRAFDRGEMRYFDFLRDKFELVRDVFDRDKYRGGANFYTRSKNPFDIKKVSPLG